MLSPCPNCQKGSKCGCKSCIERHGFDAETQTFDATGELTICPFCKIASSQDAWLDAEVAEMKRNGTWIESDVLIYGQNSVKKQGDYTKF